jgi:hypothetical protein
MPHPYYAPHTLQMSARGVRRPATPPTCPSALQTSAKGVRQLHTPHHTTPLSQRAESEGMETFGAGEPEERDMRWRRVDVDVDEPAHKAEMEDRVGCKLMKHPNVI